MAPTYDLQRGLARQAVQDGDALAATVHWSLAAHSAGDRLSRVAAVAAARQSAEIAFHQAVYAANAAGHSWRALAEPAGLPWQTLHRRYRRRPPR